MGRVLYPKLTLFLNLFFLIFSTQLKAEYRAYQYMVSSLIGLKNSSQIPKSYLITSTLDPISYIKYHGGIQRIRLVPLRTWMCPGDTSGFKRICSHPYSKSKDIK